jgi:hypothetical protein
MLINLKKKKAIRESRSNEFSEFLDELTELTKKYGIAIDGCGCY